MPPCSILVNRKQLATGSFISRVPSSPYSSYGGCCAFSFSDRRVPVAIVNALFPMSCIPAFMALRSGALWVLPDGAALYTRSGKPRCTFSVGDKSRYTRRVVSVIAFCSTSTFSHVCDVCFIGRKVLLRVDAREDARRSA